MPETTNFYFGSFEEKLADELITGRNKGEIIKEFVEKGLAASECEAGRFINYFERHLLSGSRFLGKNGRFLQDILDKYKSSPEGRQLLRKIYKQQIIKSIKRLLISMAIIIIYAIFFLLFKPAISDRHNKWIELIGVLLALAFLGMISYLVWIGIVFIRWYKVRK